MNEIYLKILYIYLIHKKYVLKRKGKKLIDVEAHDLLTKLVS
jgi:hypothetical protein